MTFVRLTLAVLTTVLAKNASDPACLLQSQRGKKDTLGSVLNTGALSNRSLVTVDTVETIEGIQVLVRTAGSEKWALLMRLAKGSFCYGSPLWTNGLAENGADMLGTTFESTFDERRDAKSLAFHELHIDATKFETDQVSWENSPEVHFAAADTAERLITTNDVAIVPGPDADFNTLSFWHKWTDAFGVGRARDPAFYRAGQFVENPEPECRYPLDEAPRGCGKPCVFCMMAANSPDGPTCRADPNAWGPDDISKGIGINTDFCGGGVWPRADDPTRCSTNTFWVRPPGQHSEFRTTLVWGRLATNPSGGAGDAVVIGDPHIRTLDGSHYTLLNQGTFSLWHLSGLETGFPSTEHPGMLEKALVDWEVYTHYSGHQAFTKGILLIDKTGGFLRVLELTAKDCQWQVRNAQGKWSLVKNSQLLGGEEEPTGFDVKLKQGSSGHNHIKLYMNTVDGKTDIALLSVSCRPGHNINLAMNMKRQGDLQFVDGELRVSRAKSSTDSDERAPVSALQRDEEFAVKSDWQSLGGSASAASYLKAMDQPGPAAAFLKCGADAKEEATKICSKHLGAHMEHATGRDAQFFDDCVFDVCAGAGEVAAELAAELLA